MVACGNLGTTVASLWMQASAVDQLKERLLRCVDNVDMTGATDVISNLEKATVTKEILEATRIGAAVNDLRKRSQQPAPELSKRCRALIKLWQKVVERPPSSCGSSTSRGGTPRTPYTPVSAGTQAALISPAVRLLSKLTPPAGVRSQPVTPGTHSKQRVTSTTGAPSKPTDNGPNNVSPTWTSSYAPSQQPPTDRISSPANGTKQSKCLPKSMSVGAELARKGVSPEGAIRLTIKVGSGASGSTVVSTALVSPSNAPSVSADAAESSMKLAIKRKADYNQNEALVNGSRTSPLTKRLKTSTPSPPTTVASTRQKVLPTAALVAQMSEDLPEHMTIDLREHEHKVREEQFEQEQAEKVVWERRKEREGRQIDKEHRRREKEARREEKRRHKITTKMRVSVDSAGPPTQEARKTDLVHKFLETSVPSTSGVGSKSSWEPLCPDGQPRDWYADLPPIDLSLLLNDAAEDEAPPPKKDFFLDDDQRLRHRSVLHSSRDRQVLGLPYVDIGLPDFVEYSFPDQQRYLAEENFMFGRSRPAAVHNSAATTPTSSR